MAMVDTYKYDTKYYVHDEDDSCFDGTEHDTLDDAIEAAKQEAEYYSEDCVYIITEVLIRQIKQTRTVIEKTIEIDDI